MKYAEKGRVPFESAFKALFVFHLLYQMISENQLRKDIIEALKYLESKKRGVSDVEEWQGGQEYGIDIVFSMKDVFGEKRKYGIQVKSRDLDAPGVLRTLGQLCVAFGHEFSDKRLLDGVYVVVNGRIRPEAHNYKNSANVGFRNVFWIESEKLLPFLKKYPPKMDVESE